MYEARGVLEGADNMVMLPRAARDWAVSLKVQGKPVRQWVQTLPEHLSYVTDGLIPYGLSSHTWESSKNTLCIAYVMNLFLSQGSTAYNSMVKRSESHL